MLKEAEYFIDFKAASNNNKPEPSSKAANGDASYAMLPNLSTSSAHAAPPQLQDDATILQPEASLNIGSTKSLNRSMNEPPTLAEVVAAESFFRDSMQTERTRTDERHEHLQARIAELRKARMLLEEETAVLRTRNKRVADEKPARCMRGNDSVLAAKTAVD